MRWFYSKWQIPTDWTVKVVVWHWPSSRTPNMPDDSSYITFKDKLRSTLDWFGKSTSTDHSIPNLTQPSSLEPPQRSLESVMRSVSSCHPRLLMKIVPDTEGTVVYAYTRGNLPDDENIFCLHCSWRGSHNIFNISVQHWSALKQWNP